MPTPIVSPRPPAQRRRIAVFAVLFASLSIANFVADTAESIPKDHDPVAGSAFKRCHDGKSLTQDHLQGDWQVLWDDARPAGQAPSQTPSQTLNQTLDQTQTRPEPLKFSPNAEHPDSLMGELAQGGRKVLLAGDFEDGQLVLEESLDGQRISATWTAQVKAGSCGTAFVGTWVAQDGERATAVTGAATSALRKPRTFVMRRAGGW
jgi:hypothetical protein